MSDPCDACNEEIFEGYDESETCRFCPVRIHLCLSCAVVGSRLPLFLEHRKVCVNQQAWADLDRARATR